MRSVDVILVINNFEYLVVLKMKKYQVSVILLLITHTLSLALPTTIFTTQKKSIETVKYLQPFIKSNSLKKKAKCPFKFDETLNNDPVYKQFTNCLTYAVSQEPHLYALQPGELYHRKTGKRTGVAWPKINNQGRGSLIEQENYLRKQFQKDGFKIVPKSQLNASFFKHPPAGHHYIAVVTDDRGDYHVMRQNQDNTWSEKAGWGGGPIIKVGKDGIITNYKQFLKGHRKGFVGVFSVPNLVREDAHAYLDEKTSILHEFGDVISKEIKEKS